MAYNIVKYSQICKYNQNSALARALASIKAPEFKRLKLDLSQEIKNNIVLSHYSTRPQVFENSILDFLDFENQGFLEDIEFHTATQMNVTIE